MWDAGAIHSRLAAARAADPDNLIFGAGRHGHRLGPVLSEAEVGRFEADHDIELPADYRAFLLEVGDGGAGPYYGLFPLDGTGMHPNERDERSWPGYLAAPFPLTDRWNPDYFIPHPSVPDQPGVLTEDEYFDDKWTAGSLVIAEFGCGAFHRLVITGPARGQVWFDDRGSDGGLTPGPAFLPWYLDWLAGIETSPIRR